MTKTKIIGVGNEFRHDDGLGILAARRLISLVLPSVVVLEDFGEGTSLMDNWGDADKVIIIDAVNTDYEPGKIIRLSAHEEPIPTKFFNYSTHAFGVAEAIELARSMDELPSELILFGIQGVDFSSGSGLSETVEKSMDQLVEFVLNEISEK